MPGSATATPTYPTNFPINAGTPRLANVKLLPASTTTAQTAQEGAGAFAPGTNGTRINEIRISTNGVAPGGTYNVVLRFGDGTTSAIIFDVVVLQNAAWTLQAIRRYDNLVIKSGGSMTAEVTTTIAASAEIDVVIEGNDLQVAG